LNISLLQVGAVAAPLTILTEPVVVVVLVGSELAPALR
jgi:hypothetical protein